MIVSMKKISLLCLASDAEATLEALRELGAMHLAHVKEPQSAGLDTVRQQLARATEALNMLDMESKRAPSAKREPLPEEHGPTREGIADSAPLSRVIDRIHSLTLLRKEFTERSAVLKAERKTMAPYGDFDPAAIEALTRKGIRIKLFQYGGRKLPAPPEGAWLFPLSQGPEGFFFAVAGLEGDVHCGGCEFVPHHRPLSVVERDLNEATHDIEHTNRELRGLIAMRPALKSHSLHLEQQAAFLNARAGMGAAGQVAYLQGFCPVDAVDSLRQSAEQHGWGLLIDDPAADEPVPTLIRNPKWIRPIRFLFDLIGVTPGYREVDISAAFMVFYSIFFAILVGDAGYGLLFLGLTAIIRFAVPKAPRELTSLLGLLSVCTIIWGVLTGNYFAITPLPAPLATLQVNWLLDDRNLMSLCFLLGAIHLTIAHVWNVLRIRNSTLVIAQFGWIALTWTMFFAARTMILDYPFPPFMMWVFYSGLTAIVLFMTPVKVLKTEWPQHIMLPLTVINNFGDVVSYVRLFAVGSASAAISIAFNELAIGAGINSVGAGLVAALILFAAHGMNIMLCALGVIVHGVRLNTLEFCGHMGIQWTGFKYKPFARETSADPADQPKAVPPAAA